ncbi:MAG: hypothetical protein MK212_04015 [Saprospiraceae bacterium]|nr:hypothetical protein [Saprospiraceae bacterium]
MKHYFSIFWMILFVSTFSLPADAAIISAEEGREPNKETKKLDRKVERKVFRNAFKKYKSHTKGMKKAEKRAYIQEKMAAPKIYGDRDIFGPIWLVASIAAMIAGLVLLFFGFPIFLVGASLLGLGLIAFIIWIVMNF